VRKARRPAAEVLKAQREQRPAAQVLKEREPCVGWNWRPGFKEGDTEVQLGRRKRK
jgi:hypothetical protein